VNTVFNADLQTVDASRKSLKSKASKTLRPSLLWQCHSTDMAD